MSAASAMSGAIASTEHLQAYLPRWMREVADLRVHSTTAEPPAQRFERDER